MDSLLSLLSRFLAVAIEELQGDSPFQTQVPLQTNKIKLTVRATPLLKWFV